MDLKQVKGSLYSVDQQSENDFAIENVHFLKCITFEKKNSSY